MEPDPLPRKQLIVHSLPHQSVPKGVGGAVDDQHAGGDGLARRSVDGLGRLVAHGDEQLVLDPDATGGDQPEHALRGLGELVVASQQDVAESVGEAVEAAHPAAADQFLHEEGHTLGPQVHLRQLVFVGCTVEDRGRHLPHLPSVEAGEFDPRDAAIAVEFGQQCAQGAAAPELVASEGEHDQQPCVFDDPDQEAQQTQTLRIDPVHIFDHHHDGANRADILEHLGDSVVQAVGAASNGGLGDGRAAAQLGQKQRERVARRARCVEQRLFADLLCQRTERRENRSVRRRVAVEVDRLTAQHDRLRRKRSEELAHEACLADARLAPHEHGSGRAGDAFGIGVAEGVEVGIPADQRGADRGTHMPIVPRPPDSRTGRVRLDRRLYRVRDQCRHVCESCRCGRYSAWRNRSHERPQASRGGRLRAGSTLLRDPSVFQLAVALLVGSLAQVDERVFADVHGVSSGVSS